MLTNNELEILEKKYFNIIAELLERNIGRIIAQVYSQNAITGAAVGGVTNVIEHAVENVIEAVIANQLQWNVCSMPVSADSCFECGDAIVHIDAKTVDITDGDSRNNKVTVQASQTNYIKGSVLSVSGKNWEPKLNLYENHVMFGEVPNITYIVKVIYSGAHCVEQIKLISLPHGQLNVVFGGSTILGAGRKNNSNGIDRDDIRFKENSISGVQTWRTKIIYERK